MTLSNPSSGHALGLPAVTRRTLLRASPAFCVGLLPAAALAASETPILQIYREYEALVAQLDNTSTTSADFDRLYPLTTALEERMQEEPITCIADLAAKVLVLTAVREADSVIYEPAVRAECEAILAGVAT